jgi:hypothetical protein
LVHGWCGKLTVEPLHLLLYKLAGQVPLDEGGLAGANVTSKQQLEGRHVLLMLGHLVCVPLVGGEDFRGIFKRSMVPVIWKVWSIHIKFILY